jgi:hypothetical protein
LGNTKRGKKRGSRGDLKEEKGTQEDFKKERSTCLGVFPYPIFVIYFVDVNLT